MTNTFSDKRVNEQKLIFTCPAAGKRGLDGADTGGAEVQDGGNGGLIICPPMTGGPMGGIRLKMKIKYNSLILKLGQRNTNSEQ